MRPNSVLFVETALCSGANHAIVRKSLVVELMRPVMVMVMELVDVKHVVELLMVLSGDCLGFVDLKKENFGKHSIFMNEYFAIE